MSNLTIADRPKPDAFRRLITDYLLEKRAGGVSPKTVSIYRDALEGVLLPYCAIQGVTEPAAITSRHLNTLNAGLIDGSLSRTGRPLSKATVHSYVRAINSWLKWVGEQGEGTVARAQLPRMTRRVLDTLSRDELQAMEDAADSERDKLIVRVLADTGIRLGGLLKLRLADLHVEGGRHMLRVREKGDKERLVPVQPALARRLRKYAERTRRGSASDRIFLGERRSSRTGAHEPLTDSGVQQMIRVLAEAAGITKRVYPHLLRHSFATDFLRRGGNPLLLQQILGHTSLQMIQSTYSHLTISDAHAELMRVMTLEG